MRQQEVCHTADCRFVRRIIIATEEAIITDNYFVGSRPIDGTIPVKLNNIIVSLVRRVRLLYHHDNYHLCSMYYATSMAFIINNLVSRRNSACI